MIEIYEPRWHDRKVLVAAYKVKDDNEIVFTRSTSLSPDTRYKISGAEIKKYPLGTNGKIDCYEVPLDVITKNK